MHVSGRHMQTRSSRAIALAAAVLCALAIIPSSMASAYNEDCEPGDTKLLGGDTGGPLNVSLMECDVTRKWVQTATYSAADEKLVVWEPRDSSFDSPLYSPFNPYTGDYAYTKANELYPTSSAEKTNFASLSLTAKALALLSRNTTTTADACNVIPQKFSDDQISRHEGLLPPQPKPDGATGTLTFTLADNLTGQQRAGVLDMLAQYDALQVGTPLPRLVEWKSGDGDPPVINFTNGQARDGFDSLEVNADTIPVTTALDHDGLYRWETGDIELAEPSSILSPLVAAHELLHVLGYDDALTINGGTMSASTERSVSDWRDIDDVGDDMVAFDQCTQAALGGSR